MFTRQFTFYVVDGAKYNDEGTPVFVTLLSNSRVSIDYLRKQINAKPEDIVEIWRKDINSFSPFQTEKDLSYVRNLSKFRITSPKDIVAQPEYQEFYMENNPKSEISEESPSLRVSVIFNSSNSDNLTSSHSIPKAPLSVEDGADTVTWKIGTKCSEHPKLAISSYRSQMQ